MVVAKQTGAFSITKFTKDRVPALPFGILKNSVLGNSYNLSLVFIGDRRSRTLNSKYRNKDYTPNVLSFPLDNKNGEIFINLRQARREHRKRAESFDYFIALLFIHSMLHLIGMHHGSTMEDKEQIILKRFKIKNIFN